VKKFSFVIVLAMISIAPARAQDPKLIPKPGTSAEARLSSGVEKPEQKLLLERLQAVERRLAIVEHREDTLFWFAGRSTALGIVALVGFVVYGFSHAHRSPGSW
jgi:hypothetical protein